MVAHFGVRYPLTALRTVAHGCAMAQRIRVGRPKPNLRVESVIWTGVFTDIPAKWRATGCFRLDDNGELVVTTLHGQLRAEVDERLVGNHGSKEFMPVASDVYDDKYEDED